MPQKSNFFQKLDKNHEISLKNTKNSFQNFKKLDLKTQKLDFSAFPPSAPQWNYSQKSLYYVPKNQFC